MVRLFHVSEEPGIRRFEPRPNYRVAGEMVWAVDEAHLANFLTPRACPRITFWRAAETTASDADLFLRGAQRVVAFEAAWLERVRRCVLQVYELPPSGFEPELAEAGYWISREAVEPIGVEVVGDAMAALVAAGAEVRILQSFWPLSDAVARSSLGFSIIHKERAAPRAG